VLAAAKTLRDVAGSAVFTRRLTLNPPWFNISKTQTRLLPFGSRLHTFTEPYRCLLAFTDRQSGVRATPNTSLTYWQVHRRAECPVGRWIFDFPLQGERGARHGSGRVYATRILRGKVLARRAWSGIFMNHAAKKRRRRQPRHQARPCT